MQALLADWPVERPADWISRLNEPQDELELAALRGSRDRGRPYGHAEWTTKTAARLGVEHSLRPIGRPRAIEGGGKKIF